MSESKKYYWLKLKSDFFDDDTIKFIEEQENGIKYSNFYLKLCLKSLKTDGKLIRLVGETLIPYDINSLSKLTGVEFDTVRSAMQLFESIGLIKVLEGGEIYLSQIDELIGSETDKAQIMRRLRAERKLAGNIVTQMLPEKEIDIEKEKDIEKENKNDLCNNDVAKIDSLMIECLNTTNTNNILECTSYLEKMPIEVIEYALKKTARISQPNWKYAMSILDSYVQKNIDTLEKAKADDLSFKSKKLSTAETKKEETFEEQVERYKREWGIEDED